MINYYVELGKILWFYSCGVGIVLTNSSHFIAANLMMVYCNQFMFFLFCLYTVYLKEMMNI